MKTNKKVAGCFLAVFMLLAVSVASAGAYTVKSGGNKNIVNVAPSLSSSNDFNHEVLFNNGDLDLATTNSRDNDVSVLLNNGNGVFGDRQDYKVGTWPSGIVAGDFDGDDDLDLAIVNGGNSNDVSVFLNNGNGVFGDRQNYKVGNEPYGIVVGDFDGDDDLDLAITNYWDNDVSVLLNNGNGVFGDRQDYKVGSHPHRIVAGDFDNDGDLDLTITNREEDDVSVLLNNGNGVFGNRQDYNIGSGPTGIVVGDFDGDDDLDLAITNYWDNDVSVLLNNGNGVFGDRQDYKVGTWPNGIVAGDFNSGGGDVPPTAWYTWEDADGDGPGTVIDFDASDSTDDKGIVSYEWDWTSDGTYDETGMTASYDYGDDSHHDCTLRVTDTIGQTGTIKKTVYANGGNGEILLSEGFEYGIMPPPGGWTVNNGNTNYPWEIIDAENFPQCVHSGDYAALIMYDHENPSNNWLVSPYIDLTGCSGVELEFWALSRTLFKDATVELHIMGNGFDDVIWDMVEDEDWLFNEYRPKTFNLSNYIGSTIRIGWRYVGENGEYFGLDDIAITNPEDSYSFHQQNPQVQQSKIIVQDTSVDMSTVSTYTKQLEGVNK